VASGRPDLLAECVGLAAGFHLGDPDEAAHLVVDIEMLGQTKMPDGTISYSLGVMPPGGRELFVDVEDA